MVGTFVKCVLAFEKNCNIHTCVYMRCSSRLSILSVDLLLAQQCINLPFGRQLALPPEYKFILVWVFCKALSDIYLERCYRNTILLTLHVTF